MVDEMDELAEMEAILVGKDDQEWVRESRRLWATRRAGFDAELRSLFQGVGLEVTDVDLSGWGNTVALTVVPSQLGNTR